MRYQPAPESLRVLDLVNRTIGRKGHVQSSESEPEIAGLATFRLLSIRYAIHRDVTPRPAVLVLSDRLSLSSLRDNAPSRHLVLN